MTTDRLAHNAYNRARYASNLEASRAYHRTKTAEWRRRAPAAAREVDRKRNAARAHVILLEKLRRGRCAAPDCPLGGLAVTPENACAFDFDHRDRADKDRSAGITQMSSPARIKAEMAKCDLLCAVCHRMKTYRAREYLPYSPAVAADPLDDMPTLFDDFDLALSEN